MNRIAIIFDFDETLVEESTSAFLAHKGIDVDTFWQKTVQKLILQDWDPVPAYMYKMIESSIHKGTNIKQQDFKEFAKLLVYKKGVKDLFENLKDYVKENLKNTELNFFIISSGIGELIRNSEIAPYFTDIWASDFEYDHNSEIIFPKKVVSFTDKTRYIFQISKGQIGENYRAKPYVVNEKTIDKNYHTPIKNMIYIGDGLTDVPCFSLLRSHKGTAIAVYDAQNTQAYGKAWRFVKDNRVNNLHTANYEKGSDLYNSIIMAIQSVE